MSGLNWCAEARVGALREGDARLEREQQLISCSTAGARARSMGLESERGTRAPYAGRGADWPAPEIRYVDSVSRAIHEGPWILGPLRGRVRGPEGLPQARLTAACLAGWRRRDIRRLDAGDRIRRPTPLAGAADLTNYTDGV